MQARRLRIALLAAALVATAPLSSRFHASPSAVQDDPAAAEEASPPLLIRAHRVIVRPGEEKTDVAILVERGRIVAVGPDLTAPEGARVLEAPVVCASFLDAWSDLGLERDSVQELNASPETRTLDAWDPFQPGEGRSEAVRGGVTAARVQAAGSAPIGGIGALVRVAAGLDRPAVLADACVSATIGVTRGGRVPDVFDRVAEVDRLTGQLDRARKYREDWLDYKEELTKWEKDIADKTKELEDDFKKAKKSRDKEVKEAEEKGKEFKEKRYKEDRKPREPKYDPDLEVLARAVNGELAFVVEVHRVEEIRALLKETEGFERLRLVLAGATEAAPLADQIAKRKIPVICWPAPMGSPRPDEWEDHDLSLAATLADKGVRVLIGSGGGPNARELRLLAALAVGHGLAPDKALAAVTTAPAQTFDVRDRLGSVERGHEADLLLLDGDPLDTTSHVLSVVSDGRVVLP